MTLRHRRCGADPALIVPLCRLHHTVHQLRKLDLLDYLTAEEEPGRPRRGVPGIREATAPSPLGRCQRL